MTRTLWVTNDFPPRAGGIEQFVHHLIERLPADSVRVLASKWEGAESHDASLPYPVRRLRRPLLPTAGVLREIRADIAAHDPDVVVFGAAWPLGELGDKLGRPTLGFTHGHEAGLVRVGMGPAIRRVARKLDAVGVISQFTHGALQPWMAAHTTLHDISPGVDIERFRPGLDGSQVRARYGIPGDAPLVVCVGRLVRRKGQDVLVEAWPQVLQANPDAHLLLVGDGPLRGHLERRVRALDLSSRITLSGGVAWQDLPACHAAADLFAMPCRTRMGGLDVEGLGIVFLEAQACGVPVLAGDSGGAPEALRPGESGEVVDGRSSAVVAVAVVRLLADRDTLRQMGGIGRAYVEQRYSWDAIGTRLRGILDNFPPQTRSR